MKQSFSYVTQNIHAPGNASNSSDSFYFVFSNAADLLEFGLKYVFVNKIVKVLFVLNLENHFTTTNPFYMAPICGD